MLFTLRIILILSALSCVHVSKLKQKKPNKMDLDLKPDQMNDADNDVDESNTTLESETDAPDDVDLEWVNLAVRDVAYYLRSHKFNEYDRRYFLNENETEKDFFESFPEPPLRTTHWEVRKFCDLSFMECLQYLHEKVLQTELHRSDDTSTIIAEESWNAINNSQQINTTEETCQKMLRREGYGAPFFGPLERFQWRTSASYYMCWFTMKRIPELFMFGEACDNFASCLDPEFQASNRDPRADDSIEFQCAVYSFCPDPCCPKKHTASLKQCWDDAANPCHSEAPADERECSFNNTLNTDFRSAVLNRWNVSCQCATDGFEWSSLYGMCIDIDECSRKLDTCKHSSEACFNLPGSYRCGCRWGYLYDSERKRCLRNEVLKLADVMASADLVVEEKKPGEHQ